MTEQQLSLSNATTGVITALPVEFAAVCNVLGCYHTGDVGGRTYRLGTVPRRDNQGAHTVVACCLSDPGNSSAAAGTAALLADCANVDVVIMCGIAGAVPNPAKPPDHVRLGDIVVTNRRGVVQYDHESVREQGVEIREKWYSPSRILLNAALQLDTNEKAGDRPWDRYIAQAIAELGRAELGQRWQRPATESDLLREFASSRGLDYLVWLARVLRMPAKWAAYRPVRHPCDNERPTAAPKVFRGVIASADKLQRNTKKRNFLQKRYGAMAVEMEGSGVANAAYEFDAKFFVVRGTADYCNEHKNNDWHYYAAIAAAAYTRALLEITPLSRLSVRGDGPTTTSAQVRSVQSALFTQPQVGDIPTPLATDHAGELVQRELGRALEQLLEEEGERKLNEITHYLDAWEFLRTFSLANDISVWVEKFKYKLSKELVMKIYTLLVRVEIVRARQEQKEGMPPDMSRAEYYLMKAKNVSGK